METDSEMFIRDSGASADSDAEDGREEKASVCDLRVDSCLICGEAAVFYDAGGDVIKRERSSGQFSYQQLFDCLCECVELRKNCKLKKDWDFYSDPFPACEFCEQLLVALAELYFKVELAEEELRAFIQCSEDKYLRCNLYEKHHEKYRSFRKQVLKKDIFKRQIKVFQNTSANEKNNGKTQVYVQPENVDEDGEGNLEDEEAKKVVEVCEKVSVQLEVINEIEHPYSITSEFGSMKKAATTKKNMSSREATERRSLRKRPKPTYFSDSSDNETCEDEPLGDMQPLKTSPDSTSHSGPRSSDSDSSDSDEEPVKKRKRVSTSRTVKRKASPNKASPISKPSVEKPTASYSKPKRKYNITTIRPPKIPTATYSRCPVCDKPIRKDALQEYREHYWSHLSDEEKRAFYTDKDVLDLSTIPPMTTRRIHHRKAAPFAERIKFGEVTQCQTCGKFICKVAMRAHQKTHLSLDKRQTYLCYLCGASFTQKGSLDKHLKKMHPDGKVTAAFRCLYPECTSSYSAESDLKSHVKDIHTLSSSVEHPNKYLCSQCGRLLSNSQIWKQHGLVHSKERKHVCHHCSKTFPLKTTLVQHLATIHGEGRKRIVCEQTGCNQEFPYHAYYTTHLRKVHGIHVGRLPKGAKKKATDTPKGTKFVCELCGVVYANNFILKAHLSRVHPTGKEGPYVCLYPGCPSNFFTEPDLQNHVQQEHVANSDYDTLCGLCGRVSSTACAFKIHQLVHTKERRHACHVCSKTFPLKATMVMHLEAVHGEGRKELKCEQAGCEDVFPTRTYYTAHLRKVHGIYASGKRKSVKRMSSKL